MILLLILESTGMLCKEFLKSKAWFENYKYLFIRNSEIAFLIKKGTTRSQVAYKLSPDAHLVTTNTPLLPTEFAIQVIVRMPEETVTKTWDLLKIFDGVAEYTVQEFFSKLKKSLCTVIGTYGKKTKTYWKTITDQW